MIFPLFFASLIFSSLYASPNENINQIPVGKVPVSLFLQYTDSKGTNNTFYSSSDKKGRFSNPQITRIRNFLSAGQLAQSHRAVILQSSDTNIATIKNVIAPYVISSTVISWKNKHKTIAIQYNTSDNTTTHKLL